MGAVAVPFGVALLATPGLAGAAQGAPAAQANAPGAVTARVFATREGLVGRTTANGHRIVAADHFVALPSTRALADLGTGDYSVRVCTATRCVWAPVWDVGPWNIGDDYWSPSGTRAHFSDLPQGEPEAQAAYTDGYHDGRDGSGRSVRNPAGIDLADGTFTDGLRLRTNAWVRVSYLWTASGSPTGTVRTTGWRPLTVRSAPNATAPAVGLAASRAQVGIVCAAQGSAVRGTASSTSTWYELAAGYYASAAYVQPAGDVPGC